MRIYRTITRYFSIINKINSSHFPSFRGIQEYLEDRDFSISHRTLQRDIQNIRNEFGIEISYNKLQQGYFILMEESYDFNNSMKFFEMSVMSASFTNMLKDHKNINKYISFDANENLIGAEFFNKILYAIKNTFKIDFEYKSFLDGSELIQVELNPILLKQYKKRWYVIGENPGNKIFLYGLDRIISLKLSNETFIKNNIDKVIEMYNNVIGVSYAEKKPEVIELSFPKEQGGYIKSAPLHQSQNILIDNDNELRIELYVVKNYELIKTIMSIGRFVKVIRPEWLRKEIIDNYKYFIKNNKI